jgi:hypothetical protein
MNSFIRWIITVLLILILLIASAYILKAEINAEVIEPVLTTVDNNYELVYFLPYAKRISTDYSYKDGSIMSRVWVEPAPLNGVHATHIYVNAGEIKNIQIIVRLQDNSIKTFVPRIVGSNPLYLPLVLENELFFPKKESPKVQCGVRVNTRVIVTCELANYDAAYVALFNTEGKFYETRSNQTFEVNVPNERFSYAEGYAWNSETFDYTRIKFLIVR